MSNPKMSAKELFSNYYPEMFLDVDKWENEGEMVNEMGFLFLQCFHSAYDRYDANQVYNLLFTLMEMAYDIRISDLSKLHRLEHNIDNPKYKFENED